MNPRRDFLKTLSLGAGATLLSPLIQRLRAEAAGKPQRHPRFVFVMQGNGCWPEHLWPATLPFVKREKRSALITASLKDHTLPAALAPVENFKDQVTLLHGLSGRVTRGGHSTNLGALGCFQSGEGAVLRCAGPSIDYTLGKAHPGIVPWLGVGITNTGKSTRNNVSSAAANKPLPILHRPEQAYAAYFGVVAPGEAQRGFALKANLLDYMAGDVKRVRAQLGGIGRERLDVYLDAYEQLADRQTRLVAIRDELRKIAPVPDDKFKSPVETDQLDAQFQIATAALIGGVTNVATIASSVGSYEMNMRYTGLGLELDSHAIGHGGKYGALSNRDLYDKIRAFHFGLIARMIGKLRAVPEGDGTLMDNTVIVYLSDAPDQHHSLAWEWPMVVIGNLGGRLKSGRLLAYPDYGVRGHRTYNGVFNSLLQAAGVADGDFGEEDRELGHEIVQKGPLAEWMV